MSPKPVTALRQRLLADMAVRHHIGVLERLARFFWGPIPWMIEAAAVLSGVLQHWADLAIILAMLLINAGVGFWQEFKADNAIALLKQKLALKARVKRDGAWKDIEARLLVPGDLVLVKLGNVVPADLKLVAGDYLSVDQSALTGEFSPCRQKGRRRGLFGVNRQAGRNDRRRHRDWDADLFRQNRRSRPAGQEHLAFSARGPAHRQFPHSGDHRPRARHRACRLFRHDPLMETIEFALILTVASIPVALPAVLSVTMAIGAERLARFKAIVSRLVSIEEMAGMNMLCSDKTGTLTKNELTLGDLQPASEVKPDELLAAAVLASRRDAPDAIDAAILAGVSGQNFDAYKVCAFQPFDPVSKRAEAESGAWRKALQGGEGRPAGNRRSLRPQRLKSERRFQLLLNRDAEKGFRTLGVARTDD